MIISSNVLGTFGFGQGVLLLSPDWSEVEPLVELWDYRHTDTPNSILNVYVWAERLLVMKDEGTYRIMQ